MDIKMASVFFHALRILTPSLQFYSHFYFFYFYSLVVFLGNEELIFLLLYATMISQAYK